MQRTFVIADFATLPEGPPPAGVLRDFLEGLPSPRPEILFVQGLDQRLGSDSKPGSELEALKLGRELLGNLGVVVVFLLPSLTIHLIRNYAINLWTWRAHHYFLDLPQTAIKKP
jgi:hypothetical protein